MVLMGMDGPFGNLFLDDFDSNPFQCISRPVKSQVVQADGYNCGVGWLMFMYDTMLAFHKRPFILGGGPNDAVSHLGKYVHSQAWLKGEGTLSNEIKDVTNPLFRLVRTEMVLMMERMRWCYLLSKHCDVTRPSEWGSMIPKHKKYVESPEFLKHIQPILDLRNEDIKDWTNRQYTREANLQKKVTMGKKLPNLVSDPAMFLDPKSLATFWLERLDPGTDIGQAFIEKRKV